MKTTGLKGVTDAMGHCKSMHDKNPKNQMVRSMKSYAEGGSTEGCGPGDGGRSRGKGCKKVTKYGRRGIPEGVKKAVGAVATGVAGALVYKNRDAIKEKMGMKTGGSIKRK
jgi:hypothetical protein